MWSIDPHTKAKHEILEYYLKAWFSILASTNKKILYLDGFAGPGLYQNGEEGSPLIALRTAIEHKLQTNFKAEIIFIFIEKDLERASVLKKVLIENFNQLPENISYFPIEDQFAPTFSNVLDKLEENGSKLAPTFAFLDPFGFSGLPMKLIGRMMTYDKCEVLITFMSGFVNRFTDELREQSLDELFGTEKWREIHNKKNPSTRQNFLLELYLKQLKEVGGVKYIRNFEMIGMHNQTIYHLIYGTNHWVGLRAMKEAMLKVDRRGTYSFSDRTDVNQKYLIDYAEEKHWTSNAANIVFNNFKGQTVSVKDIEKFVIIHTPFIFRKTILEYLEKCDPQKIIDVQNRKRRFKYPDGCKITFSDN